MSDETTKLTDGPVWRALAGVSAPMSMGILGVLSVGLADAYFLSRLGGAPLAAIGFIYPVITAVTSLSIGLSAGANAVVSQALGREEDDCEVSRLSVQALGLGVVLSILIGGVLWLVDGPLFGLLGASGQVAEEVAAYMPWWIASFPFLVIAMLIGALFRSHGRGGLAAIFMIVQAVANIALDPLLIFGLLMLPEMGTAGAGAATFGARVLAAALSIWWAWRIGLLTPCDTPLTKIAEAVSQIGRVAAPAAFSNAINPAGMAAVTAAVATLGDAAVAGFGAATRVQSIALVPLLALSAGIGPVVGQNWGADKRERAAGAIGYAFAFCVGYGLAIALALIFLADPVAAVLTPGAETQELAALYLRIVGWSLFGYGIVVVGNAAMNARDKALWSMSISIARVFALYVPLAWAGVMLFGFVGILGAAVIANVGAAAGALWATRRTGLLPERQAARRLLSPAE